MRPISTDVHSHVSLPATKSEIGKLKSAIRRRLANHDELSSAPKNFRKVSSGSKRRVSFFLAIVVLTVLAVGVFVVSAADGTWTGTTSGTWLTVTNWSGSVVPGSKTTTTNTDIANFASGTANTTNIGINMSTQAGNEYLGAFSITGASTTAVLIMDSSATPGVFNLNGATVNSVANVIIRNSSAALFTMSTSGAGTMGVGLGNATDNIVNIDSTGGVTISSIISGSSKKLTLGGAGTGTLTLSGVNTYSGDTTVSTGKLKLDTGGSIANSPNIILASGTTFDVSTVTTALTLASGQSLQSSASASTATLATASGKGLTTASNSPIKFTAYNGSTVPLTLSGAGTLTLQTGNPVTVTVTGGALGVGDYKLIAKGASGTVSGTPSSVTVDGSGIAGGTAASLQIASGELYLHVATAGATPPTLTAAAGATVDADFNITFTDDPTWRAAITTVKYGAATLTVSTDYTVAAGTLTLKPTGGNSALRTAGTQSVTVTATGYTDDTVSQTIGAGAPAKLAITTQPTAPASNGATLATQPVVAIQDQYGNATTSTATVVANVGSGTWTIGGTTSKAGVSGTATFTNLTATSAASVTGATIDFTSTGLTHIESAGFNIPPPPTLYTWNVGNGAWATSSNWSPSGVPGAGDAVQFTGSSAVTVTSVPTVSLTTFAVTGTGAVTLQAGGTVTITVAAGSAPQFNVAANSSLILDGTNAIAITLPTGNTGSVSGAITAQGGAHTLTAADASGITFNSGGSFTSGTGFSGNAFGSGTSNSVVFSNGSTYTHNAGGNPFQKAAPSSVVIFNPTSTFVFRPGGASTPSVSGRTYGNLTIANSTTVSVSAANTFQCQTLTVETGSSFALNGTGSNSVVIKGDIVTNSTATVTISTGTGGIQVNGGGTQSIGGGGGSGTISLDDIQIASGTTVSLVRSITQTFQLLVNGTLDCGTNQITAGTTGTTVTLNGTVKTANSNGLSGATSTTISSSNSPTIALGTSSTIEYNGTGSQSISPRTDYANLNLSGSRGGGTITFPAGTVALSLGLLLNASNVNYAHSNSTSTIEFNNASNQQTIPAFNFNNLTSSGAGTRTLASSGIVGIAGTFTPGGNLYTVTGSTIEYNGSGAQSMPSSRGFTYNNLSINNAAGVTAPDVSGQTVLINTNLSLKSGALTMATGNGVHLASGVTIDRSSGSISAAPVFDGTVNVSYTGASGVTSGGELPTDTSKLTNLIVNKSGGVVLSADVTVNGVLTFTSGNVDGATNAKTLTLASGATVSRASGHVIGSLKKINVPDPFTFDVGTANGYSPVQLQTIVGSGDFTASATQATLPGLSSPQLALKRYWTLTNGGLTSTLLKFTYLDPTDIAGTEANYRIIKDTNGAGAPYSFPDGGVDDVDDATNTATTILPVTAFSRWSLAEQNAPTAVKLTNFTATNNNGEVMLQWQSGYEVGNLGYYLYREQNGKRTQLTPELIAGSALMAGPQTVLGAGLSFTWYDELNTVGVKGSNAGDAQTAISSRQAAVTYWLEDVDVDGSRTLHGPIAPQIVYGKRSYRPQPSDVLGDWRRTTGGSAIFSSWPAAFAEQQAQSLRPRQPIGRGALTQQEIAGLPCVKLAVTKSGWYRVTVAQLLAAGFNPKEGAAQLQLYANAIEVPLKLSGDGTLASDSDYIEFYGHAMESPTDAAQTYYLLVGKTAGRRIGLNTDGHPAAPTGPLSYDYTIERKDRLIYYASLLNGDGENMFGQLVRNALASETLPVSHLDASAAAGGAQAQLEVRLAGVTKQAHNVAVSLNGQNLGTIDFSNNENPTMTFDVAAALLTEGDNTVQLTALNGDLDISLVDIMRLTYPHLYVADNDALAVSIDTGKTKRISGFSSSQVRAVDITDPKNMMELQPRVSEEKPGVYSADLQLPGASARIPRTVLVFADNTAQPVASIRTNDPSAWWSHTSGSDYVIVTTAALKTSVEPLAALRRSQGLVVDVVDVEDLYDEFSFGQHSPQAIHDFLQTATSTWQRKPHFVLLAGDASYDPKNYLGHGQTDLVPTKLLDTAVMETASDDWLADFDADGIADLAVGRLPVNTAAELDTVVNKIIAYENMTPDPQRGVTLVADNGFEAASTAVQSLLPAGTAVASINRSSTDDATTHNQIIASLNQGPKLANYFGHGSNRVWTGAPLLSSTDAPALTNQNRLTMFVMMTCFNGYFLEINGDTLSEALIKSPGGAVAVWASSGLTDPSGQNQIDQELYRQLFGGAPPVLGDAVRMAKQTTPDADVRRTWILFGDPATRLR